MEVMTTFGRTGLKVSRIGLGGFPFGGVNEAAGWNPFTDEGRRQAIETVRAALDAGINYIDTAPGYGDGNSESIIGQAIEGRRDEFVLATKVGYHNTSPRGVKDSVAKSLERLRTESVDIVQFHGGDFTEQQVDAILNGGLLAALEELREEGKVRYVGFTTEEPWTARPLIASGRFDVAQLNYNLIYQSAARHVLQDTSELDMGVAAMRTMTSGILQRIAGYLAPGWHEAHSIYEVALKYVLGDSRVHVANVGMRWPHEVEMNMELLRNYEPPIDMADMPRWTAQIYKSQDEMELGEE